MLTEREVEFLRELSVFAGLRDDVLRHIATHARRIDLMADQVLFQEGEPAKEMLVVVEGSLSVIKSATRGGRQCIAVLGPGDVAGEMSLVDIQPRSAELRASAPSALVSIAHSDLASVYREDKSSYTLLVLNIAREISIRLRRLDAALANIMSEIRSVTGVHPLRRSATEPGLLPGVPLLDGRPRMRQDTLQVAGLPVVKSADPADEPSAGAASGAVSDDQDDDHDDHGGGEDTGESNDSGGDESPRARG